ncbi:MAG TPA: hypothetical protein VEK15_08160 [Vicinamibacteria bacterium]|nr:hypothetical protein [Vicinamibacteria bacterium]
MKLKSYYDADIEIGEEEPLKLGIKRLTFEENTKLKAAWREAEQKKEDEELWGRLLLDTFRKYIKIRSKVIVELDDGEAEVKRGEELLDLFGGRPAILATIFLRVLAQNSLSEKERKNLRRLIASSPSSGGSKTEAHGPKPETTAESAESEDSAVNVGATSQTRIPSGSTEPGTPSSSSTLAPSLN